MRVLLAFDRDNRSTVRLSVWLFWSAPCSLPMNRRVLCTHSTDHLSPLHRHEIIGTLSRSRGWSLRVLRISPS